MTKEQIKEQIDLEITNKTATNSVTPIIVGDNMKSIVDLLPNLILHYEGDLNSTTIPQFSDGVMNVYRVTENFTYNTVVLKTGNIIGLTSTTIILIADNQKELLQNQLDAINSATSPSTANPFVTQSVLGAYIKKINTTILPDVNGNAIIPNASATQAGLISATTDTSIQQIKGYKDILFPTNDVGSGFFIRNSANTPLFIVQANNAVSIPATGGTTIGGTLITSNIIKMANGNNVETAVNLIALIKNRLSGEVVKNLTLNTLTGSLSLNNPLGQDTTEQFEIYADSVTPKGSVSAPRMTQANKLAIVNPKVGSTITQTDGTVGIYLYTGATTGWKRFLTEA